MFYTTHEEVILVIHGARIEVARKYWSRPGPATTRPAGSRSTRKEQ